MSNNSSGGDQADYYDRTLVEVVIGTGSLIVITLMTIVGNILVILSIFTYRPLRRVQNFFLVSLACADMAVATLVTPFHIAKFISGKWQFGAVFCQMWTTFDILLCTASILNLCAIALDRYWAIHDPIHYAGRRTLKLVLTMIASVWILSALISVPPLFGWNNWSSTDQLAAHCEYTTEKGFVVYSACGSFYIPLVIMTTVYVKIFASARRRLKQRRRGSLTKDAKATLRRRLLAVVRNGTATHDTTTCQATSFVKPSRDTLELPLKVDAAMPVTITINDSKSHCTSSDSPQSETDDVPVPVTRLGAAMVQNLPVPNLLMPPAALRLHEDTPVSTPRVESPVHDNVPASQRGSTASVQHFEDKQLQNFFKEKERISVSKERRAAKTLAIIMGVFVLCWLPFFVLYVVIPFCACDIHPKVYEATNWFGYLNSGLNPVIYTIFNIDFRTSFKRILSSAREKFIF